MKKIIKTGYVYDDKYNGTFQYDQTIGILEREKLINNIKEALEKMGDFEIIPRGNNLTVIVTNDDQTIELTVNFDTINYIVTQNKDRKINGKNYYPFDKNMDKYNSIYISVLSEETDDEVYDYADEILGKLIFNMNEDSTHHYSYKSMIVSVPMYI